MCNYGVGIMKMYVAKVIVNKLLHNYEKYNIFMAHCKHIIRYIRYI